MTTVFPLVNGIGTENVWSLNNAVSSNNPISVRFASTGENRVILGYSMYPFNPLTKPVSVNPDNDIFPVPVLNEIKTSVFDPTITSVTVLPKTYCQLEP